MKFSIMTINFTTIALKGRVLLAICGALFVLSCSGQKDEIEGSNGSNGSEEVVGEHIIDASIIPYSNEIGKKWSTTESLQIFALSASGEFSHTGESIIDSETVSLDGTRAKFGGIELHKDVKYIALATSEATLSLDKKSLNLSTELTLEEQNIDLSAIPYVSNIFTYSGNISTVTLSKELSVLDLSMVISSIDENYTPEHEVQSVSLKSTAPTFVKSWTINQSGESTPNLADLGSEVLVSYTTPKLFNPTSGIELEIPYYIYSGALTDGVEVFIELKTTSGKVFKSAVSMSRITDPYYKVKLIVVDELEPLAPLDLSREEAESLSQTILQQQRGEYLTHIEQSWTDRALKSGEHTMKFWYQTFGDNPDVNTTPDTNGKNMLFISMHGGGATDAATNDQMWEAQKYHFTTTLFENTVLFVPRAPTDTWNMWHQHYMDDFLTQIITYATEHLNVDPNRVFLAGYSAGGDGVYNLGARAADRFASAAMSAGHPNDAKIENLRNLPFYIFMGENDNSYGRADVARQWRDRFAELQSADPEGYKHNVWLFPGVGHADLASRRYDEGAVANTAQWERNAKLSRVIWMQDDVINLRKYNLSVESATQSDELIVAYDGNNITIESTTYNKFTIWLNDDMVDLDQNITVSYQGEVIYHGQLARTELNIQESIKDRYDPLYIFPAKIEIVLP